MSHAAFDATVHAIASAPPWQLDGLSLSQVVAALAIMFVGCLLQANIGIGAGLLAAPILVLIDSAFVPAALMVAILPLTTTMGVRERSHIDRIGLAWALVGRVPGVIAGSWIASIASQRLIALLIGASVLFAVVTSLTGFRIEGTPSNLVVAGAASGFAASAAGIGGPPMAITYQHADPTTLRATLAAFFTVGGLMTLVGLKWAGVLGRRELELGLLLIPAVVAALLVAKLTTGRLPAHRVRPIVLTVCAISSIVLLAEEVF